MMRFKALVAILATALFAALLAATANPSIATPGAGGAFVAVPYASIASNVQATRSAPAAVFVTGVAGVPSQGVSAVVVDITAQIAPQQGAVCTSTQCGNWLSVTSQPSTTTAAPTIASLDGSPVTTTVAVEPDALGRVFVNVGGYNAQFSLDVQGYVTSTPAAGGGFVPITPKRVYQSSPMPTSTAGFAANTTYEVQIAGASGIPSDATAIFANVTVTSGMSGSIRAGEPGPDFATRPAFGNYSGLRYTTNLGGALKLGSDGKLALRSTSGQIRVTVDVQGYFSGDAEEGGGFTPVASASIYKSGPFGYYLSGQFLQPGEVREIPVAGVAGIPATNAPTKASAVLLTVAGKSRKEVGTALAIYNPDAETGDVANLSWSTLGTGQDVIAQTTAAVGVSDAGTVAVKNLGAWPADFQLAAQGWFSAPVEDKLTDDAPPPAAQDPGTLCTDLSCEPRMVAGVASAPVSDVQVFAVPQASDGLTTIGSTADYLSLTDAETTISGEGFEIGVAPDQVPAGYVNDEGVVDVLVSVTSSAGTEIGSASVQAVEDPSDPSAAAWVNPADVKVADDPSASSVGGTAAARAMTLESSTSLPAVQGTVVPLAVNSVQVTGMPEGDAALGAQRQATQAGKTAARLWVCSDELLQKKMVPTVVGTTYPAAGATGAIEIERSTGGEYGVSYSATGNGGWYQSSVRYRKDSGWAAVFPKSGAQRSYRIAVQYNRYKVSCYSPGVPLPDGSLPKKSHFEWRPIEETGVGSYVDGLDRPNWGNCAKLDPGVSFKRVSSSGSSYSHLGGVKFANVIGIDMDTSRSYSSTSRLIYKAGSKAVNVCGSDRAAGSASKIMVKKR